MTTFLLMQGDSSLVAKEPMHFKTLLPVSPNAVIADDDWEDCVFSSASEQYRAPKSGCFIAGGVTAQVFWSVPTLLP